MSASLSKVFDNIDPVPATRHVTITGMLNQLSALLCLRQLLLLLLALSVGRTRRLTVVQRTVSGLTLTHNPLGLMKLLHTASSDLVTENIQNETNNQ